MLYDFDMYYMLQNIVWDRMDTTADHSIMVNYVTYRVHL